MKKNETKIRVATDKSVILKEQGSAAIGWCFKHPNGRLLVDSTRTSRSEAIGGTESYLELQKKGYQVVRIVVAEIAPQFIRDVRRKV